MGVLTIRHLCLISLLLISRVTSSSNIYWQIEGLPKALEKNVRAQLSTIENNEITPDQHFYARADSAIRTALKALGYYEPTIDFEPRFSSIKERQILIARIFPGKPILIGGISVILRGDAHTDQSYLDLLNVLPKTGTVLNHGDYDHFKTSLTNLALCKGYFDNQFIQSQLGIAIQRQQAFWNIDYDSGKRYRFGDVRFEGSQIRDEYLRKLIPFKTGDYYQSNDLNELNHRLSSTGWFNSVVLIQEFDKSHKTKTLPLRVVVFPRVGNSVEVGIGYSINAGMHIKSTWKKLWINSYGHSMTTHSSISALEQKFNFNYKIPLLNNPIEQYYLVHGSFMHADINDIDQDSTTLIISRYWGLSSNWKRAINLHWSLDHFTQANTRNTTMLLYPSVVINQTRSYGGTVPILVYSQRYFIEYSTSILGSHINFFVAEAQNIWIRTMCNKHRFIMCSNFGWIKTNNFKKVPPNLRLFAGGNRSIRGYKYKSISPENKNGQLIGASKLVIGSLEYQYNISKKWWTAIFFDSGEAINKIHKSNFKIGAGIGLRWQSPVGGIKFDIASPVGEKNEHGLQFYISLEPEL